ncbi:MAG TPA: universal stress protein [Bacteroidales bacterium]|jgi:nucleotide-binding universal stress UspA family protein|nr:universal stress protein [Bacteroidales bacterium]MDX9906934.1 universal stress protein [Bacteroidales bacterium]HNQ82979.1 universal stress protein [Bacteroidales bacterium]HOX78592.1 universal stress protein [Bacteroidales bacterium]HPI85586.1 universal stress protein [Bacteroidales bacterium]
METAKNPIFLVPTDFSEVCANAAHRAASLAKDFNYKVVLLHVIDRNTISELKKEGKGPEWVDEKLKDLSNALNLEYGVKVETISQEGDIFTTIAEVANDIKASLIFLGTHGKVGMQKITGSFALKVVTSSELPTIVVQKRPFGKGISTIVMPITSDAGPWAKTKWAASIAKEFNSTIHIFHLPGEEMEDVITMITNHFQVNGVKFEIKEAEKATSFTKQVIDYSTARNADMILIMTNPDKSLKSFLLGSYDEDIIFNTSQIPVMCINPRDFNWKKIIPR